MKQCPNCKQPYADETLNFCLDDGEWLVASDEKGYFAFSNVAAGSYAIPSLFESRPS